MVSPARGIAYGLGVVAVPIAWSAAEYLAAIAFGVMAAVGVLIEISLAVGRRR